MGKNNLKITIIVFAIVTIIIAGVTFGIIYVKAQKSNNQEEEQKIEDVLGATDIKEEQPVEEPYTGPEIYSGDARPIAVMIDNETAVKTHAGLNSAYMIYEFIVEGGETRFMAFFKGTTPEKIGPVRSSRHYFLDYALEHDAIYVHFGWSPKAQQDIKSLKINNINGIYDNFYWRETGSEASWHRAFTSMSNIMKQIEYKKYRATSENEPVIEYNRTDTDIENGQTANNIHIKYSSLQNTSYEYDEERKVYLRNKRDYEHIDKFTGERFYAKNIIIIYVKDELLDDPENKGRRELYNIGEGTGYYITNGKYEEITWEKATRAGKTIYKDKEGNQITINDGITWVQVVPITGTVTIE